ncbi:unnamed protein product, partial [Meganyctiphanes norvegica]
AYPGVVGHYAGTYPGPYALDDLVVGPSKYAFLRRDIQKKHPIVIGYPSKPQSSSSINKLPVAVEGTSFKLPASISHAFKDFNFYPEKGNKGPKFIKSTLDMASACDSLIVINEIAQGGRFDADSVDKVKGNKGKGKGKKTPISNPPTKRTTKSPAASEENLTTLGIK